LLLISALDAACFNVTSGTRFWHQLCGDSCGRFIIIFSLKNEKGYFTPHLKLCLSDTDTDTSYFADGGKEQRKTVLVHTQTFLPHILLLVYSSLKLDPFGRNGSFRPATASSEKHILGSKSNKEVEQLIYLTPIRGAGQHEKSL
jgi:hypothetical protein